MESTQDYEVERNLTPDKLVLKRIAFEKIDSTKLYITPPEIQEISSSEDIDEMMKKKIEKKILQRCTKDGFVISSSSSISQMNRSKMANEISVVSRNAGISPPEHLNGSWLYTVLYKYTVCNPPVGTVVPVIVCSKNKIGMMCNLWPYRNKDVDVDDSEKITISSKQFIQGRSGFVAILLPKALHQQINVPECDPEELYSKYENQMETLPSDRKLLVYVKILQKKFDINDKQISAVGILFSNDDSQINEQIDDEPTEKEEPDTPNSEIDYEKNNSLSSEEDDYIEDDNEINSFEDDD